MNLTWRQVQLNYLNAFYMKKAEAWISEKDDRKLYSNIVFIIKQAIESLPAEPDNYVCCAMDSRIKEDYSRLDSILERFKKYEERSK